MNQTKKIENIIKIANNESLTEYLELTKQIKKNISSFSKTKRLCAALLKECLGDISGLKLNETTQKKQESVVFEDINNGRAKIFVNLGKKHNIFPGDLVHEIMIRSKIEDKQKIGKIDIHATYSFLEVDIDCAEKVFNSINGKRIKGVRVVAKPARPKKIESESEIASAVL